MGLGSGLGWGIGHLLRRKAFLGESSQHVGGSKNGGFPQQTWVLLLKMIILGGEMGVPQFKKVIWRHDVGFCQGLFFLLMP